jgi:hypothetical protein
MPPVEIADIGASQVLHEQRAGLVIIGRHQQMDVIGHQAIRVQLTAVFAAKMP